MEAVGGQVGSGDLDTNMIAYDINLCESARQPGLLGQGVVGAAEELPGERSDVDGHLARAPQEAHRDGGGGEGNRGGLEVPEELKELFVIREEALL